MIHQTLTFIALFATIFGIIYLFISARHKERMALIEKGADASIFYGKKPSGGLLFRIFIMNLSLLLMSIGLAIFVSGILVYNLNIKDRLAYPGTILLFAGLGLFAGFRKSSRLE